LIDTLNVVYVEYKYIDYCPRIYNVFVITGHSTAFNADV